MPGWPARRATTTGGRAGGNGAVGRDARDDAGARWPAVARENELRAQDTGMDQLMHGMMRRPGLPFSAAPGSGRVRGAADRVVVATRDSYATHRHRSSPLLAHRKVTQAARRFSQVPAKVGFRFPPLLQNTPLQNQLFIARSAAFS